ncbi:hypothetical protein DSECCO2_335310 [anaerobic digester metagenome]
MNSFKGANESKIIPQRIKEAREYCHLSVAELADKIDKSRQAVSQFENGTTNPTIEIISKIGESTGFPIQYFFKPKRPYNTSASQIPLYRGSPTKTKSIKRSYEIAAEWSSDIICYLKDYVILMDVNLPKGLEFDFLNDVDVERRIEDVAEKLRDYWSLGKGPVRDIVGILENNGFIVSKIPHKTKEVEAFSLWSDKIPHIFYEGNRDTSTSYIFSICHELGHLILHSGLQEADIPNKDAYNKIEHQANLFAGAFLLPAETFGNEYLTSNLNSFIELKLKWGVSLGAMIMRAYALEIINDYQKSYLFRQLSARGYRRHEPFDDEIEFAGPSIIMNSIKMLADSKIISVDDFVNEMALPKNVLISICAFSLEFVKKYLEPHRNIPKLQLIK